MNFLFFLLFSTARRKLQAAAEIPARFLPAAIFLAAWRSRRRSLPSEDRYLDVHGAGEFTAHINRGDGLVRRCRGQRPGDRDSHK